MYIFNMKLDQLLESRVCENWKLVQPIATFSIKSFGSWRVDEHLTLFLANLLVAFNVQRQFSFLISWQFLTLKQ